MNEVLIFFWLGYKILEDPIIASKLRELILFLLPRLLLPSTVHYAVALTLEFRSSFQLTWCLTYPS
jgi:hypothetical protein